MPYQKTPGSFEKGLTPWNKGKSIFESPEHYRIHKNALRKHKRATSPVDIADRLRTLIRNSMRRVGLRKNTKTALLLGCSTEVFKAHLERQFSKGMGWHNYGNGHGKWNIDHIVPLSAFDLSDRKQQLEAFNFLNCRPMWAIDNVLKSGKVAHLPLVSHVARP